MTDTTIAPPCLDSHPARVLFVDDEPSILSSLKRLFRGQGYTLLTANSGSEGLAVLEQEPAQLVVSDMRMPGMDGAQFLEQVRTRWPDTGRILLTGHADVGSTIAAINRGEIWRYVAKPWDDNEIILVVREAIARVRLQEENDRLTLLTRQQNEELKSLNASLEAKVAERTADLATALQSLEEAHEQLRTSFLATVHVFSSVIEAREGRLAGHSRRVANLARQLAERLGFSDAEQQDVLLAGLLHDIGKIGLPDNMLNRAFNALTALEKKELMTHPVKGQQLLMSIGQLANAATLIRSHHEVMDGSGYPDQLGGLAIPQGARILAVANDYDALQNGSLALHAHSPKEAIDFLVRHRGRRYDPVVVDAMVALFAELTPKGEPDIVVDAAGLKPGMVLTRDLLHDEGYLLLASGRVADVAMIAQLRRLEEAQGKPLQLHVRRTWGAAILRSQAEDAPPLRLRKEAAIPVGRLKPGMVLSRNLNHREGYLLLARNHAIDDSIIHQLKDIETADGNPLTVYIRVEAHG